MKRLNKTVPFVLALVVFMILPGCIGQEEEPSELTEVTFILNWIPDASHVGYYVAKDKGFYEQNGLDVEIIPGKGSSNAVKVVAAGEIDFGEPQAIAMISGWAKDLPLQCVAILYQHSQNAWFSPAELNIETPKDWEGKKVGVQPETAGNIEYRQLLKMFDVDRDKIEEIPVGYDIIAPIVTETVDVMPGLVYEYYTYLSKGVNVTMVTGPSLGVDSYSTGIVVKPDFAEQNPEVVRAFLNATIHGWVYSFENPGESIDILAKELPEVNVYAQFYLNKLMVHEGNIYDEFAQANGVGTMQLERWEAMQNTLLEYEFVLEEPLDFSELFTNEYLPTSS